jgi:hypothetical protein
MVASWSAVDADDRPSFAATADWNLARVRDFERLCSHDGHVRCGVQDELHVSLPEACQFLTP